MNWQDFIHTVCVSHDNLRGDLPYDVTVSQTDDWLIAIAERLKMRPLPTGHPMELSDDAVRYIEESHA